MSYRTLLVEIADGVATVTLNRPGELNAIDDEMRDDLAALAERLPLDDDVRVLILTGAGRAFSAGGSVAQFEQDWNTARFRAHSHRLSRTLDALEAMEKPVIAALNGVATGAGLQLALASDLRLASTEARIGYREHALGLVPGHGGATRLVKLIGLSRAKELYFTGELVSASEAERVGLVHRVVAPGDLAREARQLAESLTRRAPQSLGLTKRLLNAAASVDVATGVHLEALAQSVALKTDDHREGVRAFREKRRPTFGGS